MDAADDSGASPSPLDSVMAHHAGIIVPGSFVVLQGTPGDGMANTIDSFPVVLLPREGDSSRALDDQNEEFLHVVQTEGSQESDPVVLPGDNDERDSVSTATSRNRPGTSLSNFLTSLLPQSPTAAIPSTVVTTLHNNPLTAAVAAAEQPAAAASRTAPSPSPDESSFIVVSDDSRGNTTPTPTPTPPQLSSASQQQAEQEAIHHWQTTCRHEEIRQRRDWLALQQIRPRRTSSVQQEGEEEEDDDNEWWHEGGHLAVLAQLPTRISRDHSITRNLLSTLSPGSTIVGTKIICLDSATLQPISDRTPAQPGCLQMLRIESPLEGYVCLSRNGYPLLGPGLPALYTDPQVWVWRITCAAGAYVREGLELVSRHVLTLPHGSFVRVTRKTVNLQGLSRLRVHATNPGQRGGREVEGWISEFLNPRSGQRGPIAQPLPFPVPALYRVTLAAGAILRSGVELSSPQIGHAPVGSVLAIVGRAFSEHPMDQCIERLKLAGNGGWVSVRLNLPPPHDELVLEQVGIDGTFDPDAPGRFHLEAQRRVEQQVASSLAAPVRTGATTDLSSIDEEGRSSSNSSSSGPPSPKRKLISRSGVVPPEPTRVSHRLGVGSDERCLVCLTEERNATIVHGETGHIACCLVCARILKAGGDVCPVCRLPIDSVIQHFWA